MVINNIQKMMTYIETLLTVTIADPNISESLSIYLSHKPRLKKVLDLKKRCVKSYQPPNRKLISKDILNVIYFQSMKRNLILIKKVFFLFMVSSSLWCHHFQNTTIEPFWFQETFFHYPYFNLLVSRATYQMVGKRMKVLYILDCLST